MSLSSAGCHALAWLGLVDGCSGLRVVEDSSDFLWLKLLVVPLLGLLILTLFLLEDYCYQGREEEEFNKIAQPTATTPAPTLAHSKSKKKSSGSFWRKSSNPPKALGGPQAPSASSTTNSIIPVSGPPSTTIAPPSLPPHVLSSGTRVFLYNESGAFSVYKLLSPTSSKDFIAFYCQRNNISPDGYFLLDHRNHKRMADNEIIPVKTNNITQAAQATGNSPDKKSSPNTQTTTPATPSLPPVSDSLSFTLCVDYDLLSSQSSLDWDREFSQESLQVDKEMEALKLLEIQLTDSIEFSMELQGKEEKIKEIQRNLEKDRENAQAALEVAQKDCQEQKKLKKQEEMKLLELERDYFLPQGKEKHRLEKQLKEMKFSIEQGEKSIQENSIGIEKKIKEIQDIEKRIRENWEKMENTQKEMNRERERGERAALLQAQLEQAEKERDDLNKRKRDLDSLEKELDEQEKELEAQKVSLQASLASGPVSAVAAVSLASGNSSDLLEQQLAMQKAKFRTLENSVKDCAKWKAIATKFEGEAKEWAKWKLAVKQTRAREKILEKDSKESGVWKQRARAFEKELRELRAFRKQAVELSQLKNWAIPQPPIMENTEFEQTAAPVSAYSAAFEADEADWPSSGSMILQSSDLKDDEDFFDSDLSDFPSPAEFPTSEDDALPPVHVAAAAMSALNSGNGESSRFFGSSTLQPSAREFVPRTGSLPGIANGNNASLVSSLGFSSSPVLSSATFPAMNADPSAISGPSTSFFPTGWSQNGFENDRQAPLAAPPLNSKPGLLIIDDRETAGNSGAAGVSALSALNASSLEFGSFSSSPLLLSLNPPPPPPPSLASLSQLSNSLASVLSAINANNTTNNGNN